MITSANMEKKQIHVKKVVAVFSIFMFISAMLFAQKPVFIPKSQNQEPYYKNKWYFGISLLTSYGGFVKYGFIKIHEDGLEEITSLTEANWVRQATGQQPSKANPDQVNLFEKHQIKWETLDLLWKLRYSEYPYEGENKMEIGWAGKMFCPSDNQWEFLKKNYNYSSLNQFLYGDNLWKLLQDIQDPAWQSQYSSLK